MDKYSAEKIRVDFIRPLEALARDLETEAARLELAYGEHEVKKPWLPLNEVLAKKAIKALRRFYKAEVKQKLDDAKDGTLRYREAELKFASQKKKKAAETKVEEE